MWYGEGERIKQDTNVKSKKIEFEPYTLNDLKDFLKHGKCSRGEK